METVVLVMNRAEFEKLATGWVVSQLVTGPCACSTCASVTDIIAEELSELLAFDVMVAEMEAVEDLFDMLKLDARMNELLLTRPQLLLEYKPIR